MNDVLSVVTERCPVGSHLGFLITVVVARQLGPEGRGEYSLPVVAAMTAATFGKVGLEQANVYLFGTRQFPASRLAAQNLAVAIGCGLLSLGLLLAAARLLPSVFSNTPVAVLLMVGATIPFTIHTHLAAGLQALQGAVAWQFRAAAMASAAHLAALTIGAVLGLLDVQRALQLYVLATALLWLITVRVRSLSPSALRYDLQTVIASVRHALPLHAGMVLWFLHLRIDVFMLQAMRGPTELGHYSVAVAIAESISLATDSVAIAILPKQMAGSLPEAASRALAAVRINVIIGVIAAAIWLVSSVTLLQVFFGEAFAPAAAPLRALCLAQCSWACSDSLAPRSSERAGRDDSLASTGFR